MSKRARPLSNIDWDLLNLEPQSKRSKPTETRDEEEEEDDDSIEEEETAHIDDEQSRISQQQHGLAILQSIAVDKSSIVPSNPTSASGTASGRNPAAVQEDVPTVPLDDHYNTLYNRMMNVRFPQPDSSSSSSDDEEDDSDMEAVMNSLGRSTDGSSDSSAAAARRSKKRHKKKKRLVQQVPYDTREREECFLCSWGNRHHDGVKAKHVNVLHDIYDNQYAGCDNIDLALQMAAYFEAKIWRPNTGMTKLTKEIALEHIEGLHSLSAVLFLGESIRACKKIMFGFQNAIFKANTKYDKDAFIQFEKTLKLLCMLYKMDPDSMLFNYGKTREDTVGMGKPFRIMTQMKQVRDKDKRAKRVKQHANTNESFGRGFDI